MPEAQAVNRFFSSIANRYDLANRVMSGGMDILWRRRLARMVASEGPHDILDLATGSGDVAFTLARRVPTAKTIQGMDFCVPMLDEARSKLEKTGIHHVQISFEQADCHQLPLPDASVDAITIAFGLRNLEDREQGLREMARVLRPGGCLFVLEFTQPYKWMRPFYYFYLSKIIPVVSGWITGDREAYRYLSDSVSAFPDRNQLSTEIRNAGFSTVSATPLTASIVAIHRAQLSS